MTTLDNLRKAARRWLKALRANDPEARARLIRAHPRAPADPGLRDVQHALAKEHGQESWIALKEDVARRASDGSKTGVDAILVGGRTHEERVETFLEMACWDHHVHGKGDHRMYDRAAGRLLDHHPEIARDSLYTAIVCGDLDEVQRRLATRPEAAREAGGPRGWTPLLYLCYTRFTHEATIDNAVPTARALLDLGASPNDYYMAGDVRYTALVGVAGEGEQDSPRQPQARALFELLLERGANPFDIQVLYNTHFSGDVLWWLELVYAHTKLERAAEWADPNWSMLSMGGYGPGAYYLLRIAVNRNDLKLAEWLVTRGARPNATSSHPKFKPSATLYQEAVREGFTEMAELLVRYGATPIEPTMTDQERFIEACFRLDRDEVRERLATHPEYLQSSQAMFAAAQRDRVDVVELLLDAGVPIEIEGSNGQRALHEAAGHNALRVARLLIERGAQIDPHETAWNSPPIGWASHGDHVEMLDLLSRYSRNVWALAFRGYVDRLREVLHDEPELARRVEKDGITPLWWLPDDEEKALEIVELLLSHGADASMQSKSGSTAADWALKRGMIAVARRLAVPGVRDRTPAPPPPDLEKYERLARDLAIAYQTGEPAAMQRLATYYGRTFTWDELRRGVRERLEKIPESEKPEGYFALPHAQLLIARGEFFENWKAFRALFEPGDAPAVPSATVIQASPAHDFTARMIQPVEMRTTFPVRLADGERSTTTEIWAMLTACLDGDIDRVKAIVSARPSLVRCDYNYMPPLHLAVREGHVELVRFLAEQGAANPKYVTYPYKESLLTVATDRGYDDIARILQEHYLHPDPDRQGEEGGEIDYGRDEERLRFQKLVNVDALAEVERLLNARPELALDEFAFWSEGILMMPANRRKRAMLELLIRHGARVPDVSKWGRAYYFKHDDIAVLLMDSGMNPNHMNCHHTTLLHDMAQEGDLRKAELLLERGAGVDAVDQEFRSTPLGMAARWGRRDMVSLLLQRHADPNLAGAPWATPLAWARTKGHADIEADLRRAGARA